MFFAGLDVALGSGHLLGSIGRGRAGWPAQIELAGARLTWVPFAVLAGRAWRRRVLDDARAAGAAAERQRSRQLQEETDRALRRRHAERVRAVLDAADRLEICFQPVIGFDSGRVEGLEALARFRTEPYRSPDRWFAEAADLGMGADLELCALRLALEYAPRLAEDVYLAVNLSPEVLPRPEVVGLIADWAGRIVIEITEHAMVSEYDAFNVHLDRLRRRGVRVAVDDVGSGYSTLRHVVRLAPDLIKLDRALVMAIDTDPGLPSLIGGLAAYARDRGVTLVAEGIESAAEMHALRALGVTHGQGFYLAEPQPLDAIDQAGDFTPVITRAGRA